MLADAVTDDAHVGEVYELGGPETLTLREVARLVRPNTRILSVPMALTRIGFRVGGVLPLFPFGPDQFEGLRSDNTATDNDVDAFGVDPAALRSVRSYVEEISS
jgi:NADH dehydrogenase